MFTWSHVKQLYIKSGNIPRATIARLAVYVNVLEAMLQSGETVVSSEQIAAACGINPSQLRKDLAYFGEFGVRGVGYYIADLLDAIKRALHVDRIWNAALVGVGNLGRALLQYPVLSKSGFNFVGAFDCDPFKIGEEVGGLEIICSRRLKEKVQALDIEIGVITTPAGRAQRAANYLVEAGVQGIVNFATTQIEVPDHVLVENVDLVQHFFQLTLNLSLKNQCTLPNTKK